MAKGPKSVAKSVSVSVNIALLSQIALASASGQTYYISKEDADPLMEPAQNPSLIEVDTQIIKDGKAAVKLSIAGAAMVTGNTQTLTQNDIGVLNVKSPFAIITNAVPPPSKRGSGLKGGGAPKRYPFEDMKVGASFFVPVSDKHSDPVKQLGSTVSSANMKYAEQTGVKQAMRTKRGPGNKAVLDANGNKIREMAEVPVYNHTRKFIIRPVEAGKTYGEWVAPANGALISREV